jgi:hypothetical protein
MSKTLKETLNYVLGQSAFLQRDSFATGTDVDDIQMVAFANRAVDEINDAFPWNKLRKSKVVTMVTDQLTYDMPDDFDTYITESMWKAFGARHVVIPTENRYWAFLKAGNPGTGISYYAKLIGGMLEFIAVSGGDVINYDYQSSHAVISSTGQTKATFTSDSDKYLLNDNTLALGIKAMWKIEKGIPTGAVDMMDFKKHIKRDIGVDTPAKVIRNNSRWEGSPWAPPISSAWQW